MNIFKIEVISKRPKNIWGLPSHIGKITIGDFWETFVMPLNSWDLEEYRKQWKLGLERIKTHKSSCLIVTAQNLLFHPLVFTWTLYKEDQTIFIQNNMYNKTIAEEIGVSLDFFNLDCKHYEQFFIIIAG
jgi:hypothetical protein